MKLMESLKLIPKISETEKIALEAGSTWVDGQLFSGNPDFHLILCGHNFFLDRITKNV